MLHWKCPGFYQKNIINKAAEDYSKFIYNHTLGSGLKPCNFLFKITRSEQSEIQRPVLLVVLKPKIMNYCIPIAIK